ncbi:hypothetical protein Q765_10485 [Flavobacterium rivuli WB 3.3-2 = DSM 21788]|uniref:DoxX-like family protein n=1 Tax=Flavobacterium rivuli WB 3.3-2 = DSM 21788 TaxID=1121895 RepID=A0A0A2M5D0_9FLAO|nr:DoxX family protein [Flavobacterium rivuli]KGO86638.1 hypothetical protein Q765_10485 [Flavobacterium rivuli WB 3.3-2 = DSM 21788]
MKRDRIIYWVITSFVALMGLAAGIVYFTVPVIAQEFKHLGFPDYFRVELAIAKLTGALALIIPLVPKRIKEWAYAGFTIVFSSAIIAHSVVEGITAAISPLISLILLVISYVYFTKVNKRKTV